MGLKVVYQKRSRREPKIHSSWVIEDVSNGVGPCRSQLAGPWPGGSSQAGGVRGRGAVREAAWVEALQGGSWGSRTDPARLLWAGPCGKPSEGLLMESTQVASWGRLRGGAGRGGQSGQGGMERKEVSPRAPGPPPQALFHFQPEPSSGHAGSGTPPSRPISPWILGRKGWFRRVLSHSSIVKMSLRVV